ncbi:hypothetical protein BDK51DRAFT_34648 [Blyttiomyces helicus]|uniref:Uncharacterized protein n=1 Tax=Blyttiomyces helicus TaxID=388810 RepID=A0A4P9W5C1_9FUNG|nr:hypothetical protein BDK51DRAFT_34648 [Blyttiomyces helicus]|eukprot:RKO87601.1 hypothetical protein BDK51DRAFT_34648 [Blyttiomyces helicus]
MTFIPRINQNVAPSLLYHFSQYRNRPYSGENVLETALYYERAAAQRYKNRAEAAHQKTLLTLNQERRANQQALQQAQQQSQQAQQQAQQAQQALQQAQLEIVDLQQERLAIKQALRHTESDNGELRAQLSWWGVFNC